LTIDEGVGNPSGKGNGRKGRGRKREPGRAKALEDGHNIGGESGIPGFIVKKKGKE